MIYETGIRVRYQETDQMGVVYHANYLTWFEIGRTEFIRSVGYPYASFEERGLLLPVVNLHIQYQSPARYDDEIVIATQVKRFTGVRLTFYYEIKHKHTANLLVTGETEHVWVNEQFRPTNLNKAWPEIASLISGYVMEQK